MSGRTAAALFVLVLLGADRRVEYVGIAVGLLELLFIPAALLARPHPAALAVGLARPLLATHGYWTLLAANVGAVIMPWMIFYQQAHYNTPSAGCSLRGDPGRTWWSHPLGGQGRPRVVRRGPDGLAGPMRADRGCCRRRLRRHR
jgi:Mn2+/Fe2+ NRAMP family transporter